MRGVLLIWALCMLVACSSEPEVLRLREGIWAGSLTPMNHPDLMTPLTFNVARVESGMDIAIEGPDGVGIGTREAMMDGDTLRFVFNEPEQNELLTCALGYDGPGRYSGRCADAGGKWATVTMTEPSG